MPSGRPGRTLASPSASSPARRTAKEEERNAPGNDEGRGLRPLREDLLDEGRREAEAARFQGFDRLPRSQRGGPRLGDLRLGRRRLAELRHRLRGARDHAGSRAQGTAPGGGARWPVRGLPPASCTRGRRRRPPRAATAPRGASRADRARWKSCVLPFSCAATRTGRSVSGSASRPRPSDTTSNTSTRRPVSTIAPPRRSGPSSTTSFRQRPAERPSENRRGAAAPVVCHRRRRA